MPYNPERKGGDAAIQHPGSAYISSQLPSGFQFRILICLAGSPLARSGNSSSETVCVDSQLRLQSIWSLATRDDNETTCWMLFSLSGQKNLQVQEAARTETSESFRPGRNYCPPKSATKRTFSCYGWNFSLKTTFVAQFSINYTLALIRPARHGKRRLCSDGKKSNMRLKKAELRCKRWLF